MRLIILLGTLAIALPFVIAQAAMPFGNAVSLRFLERPTGQGDSKYTVPPEPAKGDRLEADTLFEWVQAQGRSAKGYARHVIPLDVAYLVCLGLFLGYASVLLAGLSHWPPILSNAPVWVFWLLPAVYILCDLTEDVLILVMLNWPSAIRGVAFTLLASVRGLKIISVGLAFAQVLLLCLLSYVSPAIAER